MGLGTQSITKRYGEHVVLENLTHCFNVGRITCILGESGRGKTTLLRLLMGLELPDEGRLLGWESKRISAIFQENRLCHTLSVVTNIKLVCASHVTISNIIDELERVGLQDVANQPVEQLSGGMKRRVALVRALMAEYDVLLADEPFTGLDVETKEKVMKYFVEKTKGKTVILITHDRDEMKYLDGLELKLLDIADKK